MIGFNKREMSIFLFKEFESDVPRVGDLPGAISSMHYEAASLTNDALDPFGKIPEFKYCAVRLSKGGEAPAQGSYGGGRLLAAQDGPDAVRAPVAAS